MKKLRAPRKAKALVPDEVLEPNLTEEARRGLASFWFFGTYFIGLDLDEQAHREVIEAIERVEFDEAGNTLIVIPRGFFKTSIAAAALVWFQHRKVFLEKDYYHRICVASATLGLGVQILRRIAGILRGGGKNQRLSHAFGMSLYRERKFGSAGSLQADELFLSPRITAGEDPSKPEGNFWVGSLRRVSTGYHADRAFLDDLNNRDNVQTAFQRAKVQDYFDLIQPILVQQDERGRRAKMIYTCTPWHDDDVRGRIERNEFRRREENPDAAHEWEIVKFGAFMEDGTARFPARFPLDVLDKLRRDLSTTHFAANYLCDPVGDAVFVREEWIVFKDEASFPELHSIRIAVDPNQHREAKTANCYAAIVVTGFDRYARMYVLEALGSRTWSSMDFLSILFELRERYPDAKLLIEDAHMAHFEHAVRLEEGRRSEAAGHPVRLRVMWVSVPTDRSKYARFEKLEPRHRSRSIFYSDAIAAPMKRELMDELVRGDKARFTDFLDALAMADSGVRPRIDSAGAVVEQRQPGAPPQARTPTVADIYGGRLPYQ